MSDAWRLVLADGRVVDVEVREHERYRVTGNPCLTYSASLATDTGDATDTSGPTTTGSTPEEACVGIAFYCGFPLREIVPPGQLTADERVAAERAAAVAWLQTRAKGHDALKARGAVIKANEADWIAWAIERGEHCKEDK